MLIQIVVYNYVHTGRTLMKMCCQLTYLSLNARRPFSRQYLCMFNKFGLTLFALEICQIFSFSCCLGFKSNVITLYSKVISIMFQVRNHSYETLKFCRFLLPASLIVINDIAAYICGFFFGRTPLIKLSPKKTWEGFIGASMVTMFSAVVVG